MAGMFVYEGSGANTYQILDSRDEHHKLILLELEILILSLQGTDKED